MESMLNQKQIEQEVTEETEDYRKSPEKDLSKPNSKLAQQILFSSVAFVASC